MTDQTARAPRSTTLESEVAAAAAGADASGSYIKCPFDGVVSAASIVVNTALTGANTDSRTVQLFNRGQAGAGTTLVASKAFTAGVNAAVDTETPLTLSAVPGATAVAANDILELVSLHVGATGLAAPAFSAFVTISAGAA